MGGLAIAAAAAAGRGDAAADAVLAGCNDCAAWLAVLTPTKDEGLLLHLPRGVPAADSTGPATAHGSSTTEHNSQTQEAACVLCVAAATSP